MTVNLSTLARNGLLDSLNTTLGANAVLKIYANAVPANCIVTDSNSVLSVITIANTAFASAANGAVAKANTWQDTNAAANGTAGHFRIYPSANAASNGTSRVSVAVPAMTVDITSSAVCAGDGDAVSRRHIRSPASSTAANITAARKTASSSQAHGAEPKNVCGRLKA